MKTLNAKDILARVAGTDFYLTEEDRRPLRFYWAVDGVELRTTENREHLKIREGDQVDIFLHDGTDRCVHIVGAPTDAFAESAAAVALKLGL